MTIIPTSTPYTALGGVAIPAEGSPEAIVGAIRDALKGLGEAPPVGRRVVDLGSRSAGVSRDGP